MVRKDESQKYEEYQRKPAPPKSRVSVAVRIIRGLKRRIDRYHTQTQETETEHIVNERIMARWTRRVGIFTIVATASSVMSATISYFALREVISASEQTDKMIAAAYEQAKATGAIAYSAQSSLVIDQRAWLGPSQAAFTDEVAVGEDIKPMIYHRNFGKSPALFVNVDMDIRIRPNEGGSFSETTKKIITDDANACLRKKYGTVGSVVFPESLYSYQDDTTWRDNGAASYDIKFTDRIISGKDIVIIDGCINYQTMGINAHTAFCFYYEAGESKVEVLSICGIGNQAD